MVEIRELEEVARRLRIASIEMTTNAGSGHPGGSLSSADVFTCLYFGNVMKYDKNNSSWNGRDFFVLSNGHICPVWYAALAESGCINKKLLKTFREINSPLQGHPDKSKFEWVETSTGSLGQGVSVAVGIALGLKMSGKSNRVFCSMGDGELEEGSCWEAFAAAAHYGLDNLVFFIDRNGMQQNGPTERIMGLEPLQEKLAAFNLNVLAADGHDVNEILAAFKKANENEGKPTAIIFRTTMGRGVSFMENDYHWHGKALPKDKANKALRELNAT